MGARNPTPIGEKFNLLTVLSESPSRPGSRPRRRVIAQCECGVIRDFDLAEIRSGGSKSCGCFARILGTSAALRHGFSRSKNEHEARTYSSWLNMKARCSNPSHERWENYGGRGIEVCDRWKFSFENFLADMGICPTGMSIERKKVDQGYAPENCHWADDFEQMNNTTRNRVLEFDGQKLTVAEWARKIGLPPSILYTRLNAMKWTVERTLTEPRSNYPLHRK